MQWKRYQGLLCTAGWLVRYHSQYQNKLCTFFIGAAIIRQSFLILGDGFPARISIARQFLAPSIHILQTLDLIESVSEETDAPIVQNMGNSTASVAADDKSGGSGGSGSLESEVRRV